MSELGIQYKPRLAKKRQVLAYFLAEIPQSGMSMHSLNWWILNVDWVSRQTGARIGLQLNSLFREKIEQAICLGFSASNNELEYEAILVKIELAAIVSVDKLLIQSDYQLVVGQVDVDYESRDPRIAKYVSLVKQHLGSLEAWKIGSSNISPGTLMRKQTPWPPWLLLFQ